MENNHPIVILGGGNMGGAMARSWHEAGNEIVVIERDAMRREVLSALGMGAFATLEEAPAKIAALVLAIKPQQFPDMKETLKKKLAGGDALVISIMAGIPLAALREVSPHAVRVMPNLAAQIGESMSLACAPGLPQAAKDYVSRLLEDVGEVAWLEDEEALHLATAIAGCGPGYLYTFMDALEKAAIARGMDRKTASALVRQTMLGSAVLASVSDESSATLRQFVASPAGVTQAALDVFEAEGLPGLTLKAVDAAVAKSKDLAS